jgi:hypothetical protein
MVSEVVHAVRHYPMVFLPGTGEAPPTLAVLVGLGNGVNRYVDAQGQWRSQTYIPAYVRRYPFLPMQVASQVEPILAIDTTHDWIQAQTGDPLADSEGNATARATAGDSLSTGVPGGRPSSQKQRAPHCTFREYWSRAP